MSLRVNATSAQGGTNGVKMVESYQRILTAAIVTAAMIEIMTVFLRFGIVVSSFQIHAVSHIVCRPIFRAKRRQIGVDQAKITIVCK